MKVARKDLSFFSAAGALLARFWPDCAWRTTTRLSLSMTGTAAN